MWTTWEQWPLWLERYLKVSAFHHHPDFPAATKELGDGAVFCDLEWGGSWAFHGPGLRGSVQGAEEAALVPLWDSQSSVFSRSRRPALFLFCFICSSSPTAFSSHLHVPLLAVPAYTPRFLFPLLKTNKQNNKVFHDISTFVKSLVALTTCLCPALLNFLLSCQPHPVLNYCFHFWRGWRWSWLLCKVIQCGILGNYTSMLCGVSLGS